MQNQMESRVLSDGSNFQVSENTSKEIPRNWEKFFPISGNTIYLNYEILSNGNSVIEVGKMLAQANNGENKSEVKFFSPTTEETISAVKYFNELVDEQDKQDNPPPPKPQGDNENKMSLEDLINAILNGDIDMDDIQSFEEAEENPNVKPTQDNDNGQGGGGDEGEEEPNEGGDGQPKDEDGQPMEGEVDGDPTSGKPSDEDGEPLDEHGQLPTTNNNVHRAMQQIDPQNLVEALEDAMSIERGQMMDIISTKRNAMSTINILSQPQLQQIASRVGIQETNKKEILKTIENALTQVYG
jgi:hypothetical protein